MQSLLEAYKQCNRSYYNIEIDADALFTENNKKPSQKCCDFIEEHFTKGMKAEALNIDFSTNYLENGKHAHTVSLYLLGLFLKRSFCPVLKQDLINKIQNVDKWYDFKYTWFLSCLYHDIASCEERALDGGIRKSKHALGKYMEKEGITENPFNYKSRLNGSTLMRHSYTLVENYFRYRLSCGVVDHGILGGLLQFDKLKKNCDQHFADRETGERDACAGDEQGLKWRKEHVDHFAYIADAIICHNMWTSNDPATDVKYQKFGLDELIVNMPEKRLSFHEYPLQFMLCVLDTIEPVKRFRKLAPKEILSNVLIEILNNREGFEIGWRECMKEQDEFQQWIQNIFTMKKWLDLEISPCTHREEYCYVTITFR